MMGTFASLGNRVILLSRDPDIFIQETAISIFVHCIGACCSRYTKKQTGCVIAYEPGKLAGHMTTVGMKCVKYSGWGKGLALKVLATLLAVMPTQNLCFASDTQFAFIGLQNQAWKIYLAKQDLRRAQVIDGIEFPRTYSWNPKTKQIAYVGIDAQLKLYDISKKSHRLLTAEYAADHFTQPYFDSSTNRLWAVHMPGGKSRSTNIAVIDPESGVVDLVVRKRTAQFEPFSAGPGYLYYTTATCVDDCGSPIWELWRKNLQNLHQEQLTLLNALSRKPVLAPDNTLYFASDKNGYFQIWRMKAEVGAKPEPVSSPGYNDSDPNVKDGVLYFVRASGGKSQLMMWKDGTEHSLPLPDGVSQIRNLEVR